MAMKLLEGIQKTSINAIEIPKLLVVAIRSFRFLFHSALDENKLTSTNCWRDMSAQELPMTLLGFNYEHFPQGIFEQNKALTFTKHT
jgi:hypothetical protein